MPQMEPIENAVILGGGLAGLAAAIRLKELGAKNVTVLERAATPGGLAISLSFDGVASDLGPHRLYTELPEVEQFYSDVAGPEIFSIRRQSSMFLHGKFLHYPLGFIDMLRGPGPLRLAKFGASWLAAQARDAMGRIDKQTFQGVMDSAFGHALFAYLIGPYIEKVWKTRPSELDAEAARVRVSAGSLARTMRRMLLHERKGTQTALQEFHYVRGGAQTLVNRITERARRLGVMIETGHAFAGFEFSPDNTIQAVKAETAQRIRSFPAQQVISTIPLPQLMIAVHAAHPLPSAVMQSSTALRYLDLTFVFVVVRRERIRGDQWIYFPEPRYVFNRASEARAFDPHASSNGRSVLCIEVTHLQANGFASQNDEAIISQVMPGLYSTGMFAPDEVENAYVHRLKYAYPIYDVRYGDRVQALLQALAQFAPNVITTGRQGLFNFNNMDHSIYMGMRAAETSMASSSPAAAWITAIRDFERFRIVD